MATTVTASSGEVAGRGAVFVGLERELTDLDRALVDAADGRERFVLLSGDTGIGKTRLAEEAAEHASGRCAVFLRPPRSYAPFSRGTRSPPDTGGGHG